MTDQQITDLTAILGASVATGDELVIVDVSDTTMASTGTDKKITADEAAKFFVANANLTAAFDAAGVAAALVDDLSGVTDAATARTNLGLGSLATKSAITSADITDGTIVNADINAAAAIAQSKISGLGAAASLGATEIIRFVFDGGGSALTTGAKKVYVTVPFAATITSWNILADQSGSIVFDIWKDTYANYPPTVADTITASAKPTLSSATKATGSTLTGWTTSITAGDVLEVNVDSITTCTKVALELLVTRTS